MFGVEGPHNVNDHYGRSAEEILLTVAGTLASPGANNFYLEGEPVVVLGPEHAEVVATAGFSKAGVKAFLSEKAIVPRALVSDAMILELEKRLPHHLIGPERAGWCALHHQPGRSPCIGRRRRGEALGRSADVRTLHARGDLPGGVGASRPGKPTIALITRCGYGYTAPWRCPQGDTAMKRSLAMFWIVAAPVVVAADDPSDAIPSAEEILANPLDDAAYADDVRCLASGRYRQVDILNDRVLVFRGRGGRAWINLLPRPCPGLRRDMVLAIETRGSRICSRDLFRGMPRLGPEAATSFCSLGTFRPVEADNLDAIRGALRASRANRTVTENGSFDSRA